MIHHVPYTNQFLIVKRLMIRPKRYFRKSRITKRSIYSTLIPKDGHTLLRATPLLITIAKRHAIRYPQTLQITLTTRICCMILYLIVQKVFMIRRKRIVPLTFRYASIRHSLLRTLLALSIAKLQKSRILYPEQQRVVLLPFVRNRSRIRKTLDKRTW